MWFLALGPGATAMTGSGSCALTALLNLPNMGSGNVLTFWSDLTSAIKKCSPFFLRKRHAKHPLDGAPVKLS